MTNQRLYSHKTHCIRGHELAEPNLYYFHNKKTGKIERRCKECARSRTNATYKMHPRDPVPSMPTDVSVLAYAAGIFDGEGSVVITLHRKKGDLGPKYHRMVISVSSTDTDLTDWLKKQFGGMIHTHGRETEGCKDAVKWSLHARSGEVFLRAVYPFLIVKKQQANVAFALRKATGSGRSIRVTPELFAHRESLRQQLKSLNRRGRAVADTQED